MELPNYFLADLPDSSALTPKLITDACQTLKLNRKKFLASQTTDYLISIFSKLAREWLDPEFPFRKFVVERSPELTGFGRENISAGLNRFFSQVTRENLEALVIQDLGSLRRLDEIVADDLERKEDRSSICRGHDLLVHVTGGVLPNPPITSIILGLLARSAQFVKSARGSAFLPRMFAHSLYAMQPKLGACLEIAEWQGGTVALEDALFAEAGCVAATGSDEAIAEIRKRLPAQVRFVGYGHKVSVAYITRESLEKQGAEKIASLLAEDIVAWNQLGCLSPHAVYVETGASVSSTSLAQAISHQLELREKSEPRGAVSTNTAAAISTRRTFYEVRASADKDTQIWASAGSTAWTVVHETSHAFQPSSLNRFIYVKPVQTLEEFLASLQPVHGQVSTVGLAAPLARAQQICPHLALEGITRICRLGKMQDPPLTWRHDGRPSLGDLVIWTDNEL
ncbi:MAG TPA: acyl-CoA reductase [Candidatus Kapabacteria bacterium]|nr:acyl-CoA reductase [Candidatus Kapabacteria bacterium]